MFDAKIESHHLTSHQHCDGATLFGTIMHIYACANRARVDIYLSDAFLRHKIKMNTNNYNLHVNYTWMLKMSSIFSHCFVNGRKKFSSKLMCCCQTNYWLPFSALKNCRKLATKDSMYEIYNKKFQNECGDISHNVHNKCKRWRKRLKLYREMRKKNLFEQASSFHCYRTASNPHTDI